MNDVTRILLEINTGDEQASARLLPLVYEELRKLAAAKLSMEQSGQTLQATALVHEAYLKLVGGTGADRKWNGRKHFYSAAAEAMRRILVDNARKKNRPKHGGGVKSIPLDDIATASTEPTDDILAIDEALTKFALEDPKKAELIKLRYFAGLTIEEAAEHLEVSRATASRYWTYAKAWLLNEIRSGD